MAERMDGACMSLLSDQLLLQFSDPAQVIQALTPGGDPGQTRLRTLIGAVYELPFATLHQVQQAAIAPL